MPSYTQTGIRTCSKCKEERKEKICKVCQTKTRPSGNWSVRFYQKLGDENILKRLSGFDSKASAESAYFTFKNQSSLNIENIAKLPFNRLVESFLKYKTPPQVRETTYIEYTSRINYYLLPFFKDKNVFKLKKSDIVEWHEWINAKIAKRSKQPLSHSKKTKIHGYLSTILNYANKFFDLPVNVASQVGNFRNSNPVKNEMLFWTETEFNTFLKVIDKIEYKTLFAFLYLTGCRKGEALATTWSDVDFINKTVTINKSVTFKTMSEDKYKVTAPKNMSSNRIIYLSDNLVTLLSAYKEHCKALKNFADSWYLFGKTRPTPAETIRNIFNKYCLAADVKKIRIHDFRHSHASLLINKGQNILAVAQRLGHSNIEQTLNTYSHFMPEEQKKLLGAININLDF